MANVNIERCSSFIPGSGSVGYGAVAKSIIQTIAGKTNLILKQVNTDTNSVYDAEYYVSSDTNSWIRFNNSTDSLFSAVYYRNSSTTSILASSYSLRLMILKNTSGAENYFYVFNVDNKVCGVIKNLNNIDGLMWSSIIDISTQTEYSVYSLSDLSAGYSTLSWHFAYFASHSWELLTIHYVGDASSKPRGVPYLNPYQLTYNNTIYGYLGGLDTDIFDMYFMPETESYHVTIPNTLEFTLGGQQYVSLGNTLIVKKDNT